jgi:hypothetical protein
MTRDYRTRFPLSMEIRFSRRKTKKGRSRFPVCPLAAADGIDASEGEEIGHQKTLRDANLRWQSWHHWAGR